MYVFSVEVGTYHVKTNDLHLAQEEVRSHEPAEAKKEVEVEDTLWLWFELGGGDERDLRCCCVRGE